MRSQSCTAPIHPVDITLTRTPSSADLLSQDLRRASYTSPGRTSRGTIRRTPPNASQTPPGAAPQNGCPAPVTAAPRFCIFFMRSCRSDRSCDMAIVPPVALAELRTGRLLMLVCGEGETGEGER